MKTLQLKAQLMPGKRYADGSVGILFRTAEEIGTDKFSEIDSWRQQTGWLLFKKNEFSIADIPKEDAKIEGERSPSEIMRRSLYKLFMVQGGNKDDFKTFYLEQMAKFNKLIGEKIEAVEHVGQ